MTSSKSLKPKSSPFKNFDPAAAEKKICRFIQKEVQNSGANGVILGLSGGIDSVLVAVLSAKALGSKKVCALFFYVADNKEENAVFESDDFRDAFALSESLCVSFEKINLGTLFKSAQKTLVIADNANANTNGNTNANTNTHPLSPVLSGNLVSRLRMSLLYYYANQ